MNHEDFKILLEDIQLDDKIVLGNKNEEYAPGDDKLANFKKAAAALGVTPEQALWGFTMKHIISVQDIINGEAGYTPERLREKCGDLRRYTILLEEIMEERHNREAGYTPERLREKCGELRRYTILLEEIMEERHT